MTLLWMLVGCGGSSAVSSASEPQPAAEAPQDLSTPVPDGFVDLQAAGIQVEARYASSDNFTGHPLAGYGWPAAWLRKSSADALQRVDTSLRAQGFALRVYDGYRPIRASRAMVAWAERTGHTDLLKDGYIAAKSGHNKGHTVDLTLVSLETGEPLDMGSAYDHFGPASHTANASGEPAKHRDLLVSAMAAEGFRNYSKEWWHFSRPGDGGALDVPYACAESFPFEAPVENTAEAWTAMTGPCAQP